MWPVSCASTPITSFGVLASMGTGALTTRMVSRGQRSAIAANFAAQRLERLGAGGAPNSVGCLTHTSGVDTLFRGGFSPDGKLLAFGGADGGAVSASWKYTVFAHVPLWAVYPQWGWVTDDAGRALGYLKRFGSVTVLNGHIHQIMQKVEGNVTFHTARSTAFPQPAPGAAPAPGPMKVPADTLRGVLGIRELTYAAGRDALAVVDPTLA